MRPNEDNPLRFQEVEMTPNIEDNMLQLYEAALKGSVSTLTTLIQNDPLILKIKAGSRRSINQDPNPLNTVPTESQLVPVDVGEAQVTAVNSGFRKTKSLYHKCNNYLKDQSDWVEKMQKQLMLVATLTATVSFQVAISPPGGVLQQDFKDLTLGVFNCGGDYGKCVAGTAVLGYVYSYSFIMLTSYAIVSFIASLSVVLLAISGLPLKNKLFTWLMTIAMIFAITFLLLTFEMAISMVTPDHIFSTTAKALRITVFIWISLVGIVAVFATIRLLFWLFSLLSKLKPFVRKILSRPMRNQGPFWIRI